MQTVTRTLLWLRSLGNAGAVANAASEAAVPAVQAREVQALSNRVEARVLTPAA